MIARQAKCKDCGYSDRLAETGPSSWAYNLEITQREAANQGQRFEGSAYGPWEQVQAVIFYPSIDTDLGLPSKVTKGSTNTMDHFVAYIRATAGVA